MKIYTPLSKGQIITAPQYVIDCVTKKFEHLKKRNPTAKEYHKWARLHFGFAAQWSHDFCFKEAGIKIDTFPDGDALDRLISHSGIIEDDKLAMFSRSENGPHKSYTIGKTEHPTWRRWAAEDTTVDIALNCFVQLGHEGYDFQYLDTVSWRHLNSQDLLYEGKNPPDSLYFWRNALSRATLLPERKRRYA